MRKPIPLIFIAVVLAGNAAAQSGRRLTNPPPPVEPMTSAPIVAQPDYTPVAPAELSALPDSLLNRELKSVDQGSFRLADFSGKVIVLNLWATWCGPCRREVPDYEKVRKEYAGRGVEFIGLTTEDPRTSSNRVQKFAHDFNFHFRLGWADRETARTLTNGRNVIPQTVVIAPDGRIISHWRGYSPTQSRDRLREIIDHALAEVSSQK
jgi:thiol-disulfide isomerase/thioredoxin